MPGRAPRAGARFSATVDLPTPPLPLATAIAKRAGAGHRTSPGIVSIRVGKEGAMPAYGRAFSEAQLKALVAYIRSLKDGNQ